MSGQHEYLLVVSPGPFIIVRAPLHPRVPWRHIKRALTGVMRSHGLRQKDIHFVESLMPGPGERSENDVLLSKRIDAGLALPKFFLYEWQGSRGGRFVLRREPVG